jgi:hypothetical protein
MSQSARDKEEPITGGNEALKARLLGARSLIRKLGKSGIDNYYSNQVASKFPSLTIDGHSINAVRQAKKVYLKLMDFKLKSEFAAFTLNGCWNGNEWATDMEREVMDLLEWKYKDFYSNGETKERDTMGGTIRRLLVKKKGTMLETFHNYLKKTEKRSFFVKDFSRKRSLEDSEVPVE